MGDTKIIEEHLEIDITDITLKDLSDRTKELSKKYKGYNINSIFVQESFKDHESDNTLLIRITK